jgi:putative ABC transport system ATP-binding protein
VKELFSFRNVSVTGSSGVILEHVDLEVPDGALTVLAGPSGSGKSTLLRLCNRLEAPSSGVVEFRGEDISAIDPLALRRRVGMVFQQPVLFGGTVRDNMAVADPAAGDEAYAMALQRAALTPDFLDRQADELSGGEAQRVCLARALVAGPEVLLMDEPTSALDDEAARLLESLGRDLVASGVPVIWVSHDRAQLARIADWVVAVDRGTVVSSGPAAEVDLAR